MSWLFSQALVAEYSAANSSDGAPSALSNTTPTPQAFLWHDKTTDAWKRFPSGLTCEPLTDDRGEGLLTWFREGFLAPTYRSQKTTPRGFKEKRADCGLKCRVLLAKLDPDTFLWKTVQPSLFEVSETFCETWPGWGMMRNGECWELATPDCLTGGTESGLLPTPRTSLHKQRWFYIRKQYKGNLEEIAMLPAYTHLVGKSINPAWLEWMMGWVIGWAGLAPLATDKFQQWLRSHGVSSADPSSTQPHT